MDRDTLVARFEDAGQGHVFAFLGDLSESESESLLRQAQAIDLEQVAALAALAAETRPALAEIAPPGDELLRRQGADADGTGADERREWARERGVAMIESGRVAVMVAAGGQGTRLGTREPKAMFPIGPRTGRSLLAWHAAKVVHWSRRIGQPIPFIVMLSDATAAATRTFLEDYQYFGLGRENVHTPVQGSLPPLDDDGRLLMASRHAIALSPNGHGGTFSALADGGLADALSDEGITTISYVQIDNPLIHPLDPVFLGAHDLAQSRLSSKSVAKRTPAEKVGVFARVAGKPSVVEYSELTDEQAGQVDDAGDLLFGQGSIAAHCIELGFASEMAERGLPVHRARKKVPHVGADGEPVNPEAPNATKFETFLFDAIPLAEQSLFFETLREEEFSPIKNATGSDSPSTAAADVQSLFRGWFERAGLAAPDGAIEIDPEDAPDERTFREHRGVVDSEAEQDA